MPTVGLLPLSHNPRQGLSWTTKCLCPKCHPTCILYTSWCSTLILTDMQFMSVSISLWTEYDCVFHSKSLIQNSDKNLFLEKALQLSCRNGKLIRLHQQQTVLCPALKINNKIKDNKMNILQWEKTIVFTYILHSKQSLKKMCTHHL